MSGAEVLDVGRDAIWLTIQLCAPVLIVGLVVGVGVGLMQALTQIQEATLVYAPKIVAIFLSLLLFLPLMGALMSGFYLGPSWWAMSQGMPAGIMALIGALQPLFTALIAVVVLHKRLSGSTWIGLALGVGGDSVVLRHCDGVCEIIGFVPLV